MQNSNLRIERVKRAQMTTNHLPYDQRSLFQDICWRGAKSILCRQLSLNSRLEMWTNKGKVTGFSPASTLVWQLHPRALL